MSNGSDAGHELPALVTVDDAAKALSLHPDHVRRLARLTGWRRWTGVTRQRPRASPDGATAAG